MRRRIRLDDARQLEAAGGLDIPVQTANQTAGERVPQPVGASDAKRRHADAQISRGPHSDGCQLRVHRPNLKDSHVGLVVNVDEFRRPAASVAQRHVGASNVIDDVPGGDDVSLAIPYEARAGACHEAHQLVLFLPIRKRRHEGHRWACVREDPLGERGRRRLARHHGPGILDPRVPGPRASGKGTIESGPRRLAEIARVPQLVAEAAEVDALLAIHLTALTVAVPRILQVHAAGAVRLCWLR